MAVSADTIITDFTPGCEVPIYPRHPIIAITVRNSQNPPPEFRLAVGSVISTILSTAGRLIIRELIAADPIFVKLQANGITNDNTYLRPSETNISLNFERVWGVRLIFSSPLTDGSTYKIAYRYYEVSGVTPECNYSFSTLLNSS